ncbi:hypothetical protein ASD04_00505 [Devosia sp. Root436]|uniref:spike base protein, RCAP_Rcc01079 family n=1 Tax=Devosia sp. Root436 TaxID=1736537 RepID=UPI0006F77E06|nr:hypothetical protein [Devosia sp. Root436]KQX42489.1 hypothetical protein ASD04_00505 [Devosia sp. Root436]
MTDRYEGHATSIQGPATHGFAIVPSDASDLVEVTRAIYVGGAGDVTARLLSGADVTFTAVPAGSVLPIRAIRIGTASTATNLVGLS